MANYPGPGEVRLNYVVTNGAGVFSHMHRMSFNNLSTLVPGMDFSTITAEQRDGGSMSLIDFLDGYMLVLEPLYSASDVVFGSAEVWLYTPGTFNSIWIAEETMTFTASSGSAGVVDSQLIATFRTTLGGRAKLDLRGTIVGQIASLIYPTGNALFDDWVEYASSPDTIMVGRDGGWFLVPYKIHPGVNEAETKARLRP